MIPLHGIPSLSGVFNIMATPFATDLTVDEASLQRLVNFQLDKGADGLIILGVLGEAAKLTLEERQRIVTIVLEIVAGRVPVIVGTSHQNAETCIDLSQTALAAGATGVMIAPPRFATPDDATVISFYEQVGHEIHGLIVVQDYPPVTNVILSAELLVALAQRIPMIRHLKLEDPPLMQKIDTVRARTDKYAIFGGLGGMFFLEELGRGAAGTMTGFAFTEILIAVYQAFHAGKIERAARIFDRYLPLIRFENQPVINLAIRKELLYRRGALATPLLREPFAPIDDGTRRELDQILQRVGIHDPTAQLTFEA